MQAHKSIEVLDGFDVKLITKVYEDVKRLFYQADKHNDVERVGLQIAEEPRFRHDLSILLSVSLNNIDEFLHLDFNHSYPT
jgi:hypothetical protein